MLGEFPRLPILLAGRGGWDVGCRWARRDDSSPERSEFEQRVGIWVLGEFPRLCLLLADHGEWDMCGKKSMYLGPK